MKPTFLHDCKDCSFLGTLNSPNETYDFYYCSDALPTYIARFGNEPIQYTSFPSSISASLKILDGMQGNIVLIAYHLRMRELAK